MKPIRKHNYSLNETPSQLCITSKIMKVRFQSAGDGEDILHIISRVLQATASLLSVRYGGELRRRGEGEEEGRGGDINTIQMLSTVY